MGRLLKKIRGGFGTAAIFPFNKSEAINRFMSAVNFSPKESFVIMYVKSEPRPQNVYNFINLKILNGK